MAGHRAAILFNRTYPKKPLNGLSGIIRYRKKNNLLSIQFQLSYILMTVLERLTQTKKNNFDWHPQGTAEIEDGKKKIRQFENLEKRLRQKLSKEERRTRNNHLYNQEGT